LDNGKLKKIFGVGLFGAFISLVLLAVAFWFDRLLGHPAISAHPAALRVAAAFLVAIGLCLHLWTLWTLSDWWKNDRLCTLGPFKYFRHPMYAAWISFISSGLVLYLNSWTLVCWLLVLQLLWHRLVRREEILMQELFGEKYRSYASQTGRFIPRIFLR